MTEYIFDVLLTIGQLYKIFYWYLELSTQCISILTLWINVMKEQQDRTKTNPAA
jgi:hypothetical protein